jgi:hypothetical protein
MESYRHYFTSIEDMHIALNDWWKDMLVPIEPDEHDTDQRGPILQSLPVFETAITSSSDEPYLVLHYTMDPIRWLDPGDPIPSISDIMEEVLCFQITIKKV